MLAGTPRADMPLVDTWADTREADTLDRLMDTNTGRGTGTRTDTGSTSSCRTGRSSRSTRYSVPGSRAAVRSRGSGAAETCNTAGRTGSAPHAPHGTRIRAAQRGLHHAVQPGRR